MPTYHELEGFIIEHVFRRLIITLIKFLSVQMKTLEVADETIGCGYTNLVF